MSSSCTSDDALKICISVTFSQAALVYRLIHCKLLSFVIFCVHKKMPLNTKYKYI